MCSGADRHILGRYPPDWSPRAMTKKLKLGELLVERGQLTADNQSSMLRDLAEGRRTEVDAISGAVARLGRERGALAPVNEALAALIRAASSLSQPKRERDQRLQ